MLSEREIVNHVTEVENADLVSDVSHEEVKSAFNSMYAEKSPGLDGLNPAFFQTY